MPWSECAMISSRCFRCLEALTLPCIECSCERERPAALAVRRVHRHRGVFLMDLPDRRHRRKRDRDAKGENEREKCQTWSHRKTSFWNQKINTADYSWMIVDCCSLFREQPHTRIHENRAVKHPADAGRQP